MVEMRLGLPKMNIPAPRKRWPGEDDLSDEAEREGLVGRAKELKQGLDHLCGTLQQKKKKKKEQNDVQQRVVHVWGDPGVVM